MIENPNYTLELYQLRSPNPISVKAYVPQEVLFSIQADWEPRLPADSADLLGNGMLAAIARSAAAATGFSTVVKWATQQAWVGSTPVSFQLQMDFFAREDPQKEVMQPMQDLVRMTAPDAFQDNWFLISPGPSPAFPDRNRIVLRLGRYMLIPSVVIVSVTNTFNTMMDPSGLPISGRSDVEIRTTDVPTVDDILSWFSSPRSGSTAPAGATGGL